jgi:hypothetical protein
MTMVPFKHKCSGFGEKGDDKVPTLYRLPWASAAPSLRVCDYLKQDSRWAPIASFHIQSELSEWRARRTQ